MRSQKSKPFSDFLQFCSSFGLLVSSPLQQQKLTQLFQSVHVPGLYPKELIEIKNLTKALGFSHLNLTQNWFIWDFNIFHLFKGNNSWWRVAGSCLGNKKVHFEMVGGGEGWWWWCW